MDQREIQMQVLLRRTPSLRVAAELLEYDKPLPPRPAEARLPLASEPHIETWQQYAVEAQNSSVYEVLQQKLVQLRFPIARGISQSEAYRAVTRKGDDPDTFPEASGLPLERAEALQLRLHSTLVGVLPAIITDCRHDFVVLVQALVKRNEPELIPDSMGSCLVSGYNNWDRVCALRRRWEASESDLSWVEEFHRYVKPHKQLYQDRFLILSSDAYSHIPAEALGLSDAEWRAMSITIRLEHEATHYLVSRLYAQIRTNVLDELWADYRGIVAVLGDYRADWGLRFLGLHDYPAYQPGARLENYRKSLSDEAFCILQSLVKDAADNLERIERHFSDHLTNSEAQDRLLLALTCQTLEELASENALSSVQQALGSF